MICSLDFYRSEQSLSNDMMKYRLKDKELQRSLDVTISAIFCTYGTVPLLESP